GTAARLAAERGADAGALAQLRSIVSALDETLHADARLMQFDRYVELNAEFHLRLSALSGSDLIRREIERATRLPFASPSAFLRNQADVIEFRQSLTGAQAQHRAILDAIELRE